MRNFQSFIKAASEAIPEDSSPKLFRTWAAISAVAGALGRKAYYDMGPYRLRPNLYICLIGDSGIGKTQSLSIPYNKVYANLIAPISFNEDVQEEYKRIWSRYIDPKNNKPLRIINERITGPQLEVRMSQISAPANIFDDNTFDHIEYEAPLTLVTREFGVLVTKTNETLHTFLTDAWDCNPTAGSDLKTGGTHIVRGPCLNWISCAVPTEFIRNMPENAQEQGLLSRIIPVYFTGKRGQQDIWYGTCTDDKLERLREDLGRIAMMRGRFTFASKEVEDYAREDVREGIQPAPTDPKMREYGARRPAHLLKIAMCVSASHRDDLLITKSDWLEARALLLEIEKSMPKLLAAFGMRDAGHVMDRLTSTVRDYCEINKKDFMPLPAAKRAILTLVRHPAEIDKVIEAAIASGLLAWVDDTRKAIRWTGVNGVTA